MRIRTRKMGLAVLALAVAASLTLPTAAFGVVNLGTVSVSMPGSVSVASGSGATVSAAVSPAYSDQMPNCMNDYCPSGCDFDKVGSGTACEDPGTGQCTCYGYSYSRYYPSCTVSSSDPSVARASWSGGTLNIQGYRAGTATITVYPSLRLFSSASSSIAVTVNDPAPVAPPSAGGASSAGSGSASDGAGLAAAGGSGSVSVGAPSSSHVVSVVSTVAAAEGEEATAAAEDTYHLGDEGVSVPDLLARYAGTDKVLTLWGGDDAEAPSYIWEIPGAKLSADDDLALDLTVADVADDETLAGLLEGLEYTALRVAQEGALPGTMQLFWRTAAYLPNDAVVDVYAFDEEARTFAKVYSNLKTAEGYLCFNVAQGGVYVMCEDSELEGLGAAEEVAADEPAAPAAPASAEQVQEEGVSWALVAGVAAAVVVVVGAACVVAVRRRARGSGVAGAGKRDAAGTQGADGGDVGPAGCTQGAEGDSRSGGSAGGASGISNDVDVADEEGGR